MDLIGKNIKIQRSSGHVHSAMISEISDDKKIARVEWSEGDEFRAKNIELKDIFTLNPDLFPGGKNPKHDKFFEIVMQNEKITFNGLKKHFIAQISLNQAFKPVYNRFCNETRNFVMHPEKPRRSASINNVANITLRTNVKATQSYIGKRLDSSRESFGRNEIQDKMLTNQNNSVKYLKSRNSIDKNLSMISNYQKSLHFNPLIDGTPIENHQITVCVRKRPLNQTEMLRSDIDVISVTKKDSLIVHEPKCKVDLTKFLENHNFRFDYVFNETCSNDIVYKYTAKPLVKTIFEGGKATCFAYGQTGSGKTHTMGGEFSNSIQDCTNGIYGMAAKDVFALLKHPRYKNLNLIVGASFFEIYGGKVFDLLADKRTLRVLEDGRQQVQVVGLSEAHVNNVKEIIKVIQQGNSRRASGQTSANESSSRSHAVFQIILRYRGSKKVHGKFSFIDLAGNERGADTSTSNRQTRIEGAEINKSLLALKECIRALGRQNAHLPFRVSKLTQVLKDSFIGKNSKTCMIAMISPGLNSCEHTLNTLRYADRVKELIHRDSSFEGSPQIEIHNSDLEIKRSKGNESEVSVMSCDENDESSQEFDMQQMVEFVAEKHKMFNEFCNRALKKSIELHDKNDLIHFNQVDYCKRGEQLFGELMEHTKLVRDYMMFLRVNLEKMENSCNP